MNSKLLLILLSGVAGLAAGILMMKTLIRLHGRVRRNGKHSPLLELPMRGAPGQDYCLSWQRR
ncbi:MAG: hypothetical protein ACLFUU_08965 [Desulfobacteraceae bacterium]